MAVYLRASGAAALMGMEIIGLSEKIKSPL